MAITITLNGQGREFAGLQENAATLADLVEALSLKADRVALELNGTIVPRATWNTTALQNGDKLELVHFVGGGCARLT